jgi:predicted Kef-type K+ transport protein
MHNLLAVDLVVVLGVVILVSGIAARQLRLAPPVLLLIAGVLLGFVPALHVANTTSASYSFRQPTPTTSRH